MLTWGVMSLGALCRRSGLYSRSGQQPPSPLQTPHAPRPLPGCALHSKQLPTNISYLLRLVCSSGWGKASLSAIVICHIPVILMGCYLMLATYLCLEAAFLHQRENYDPRFRTSDYTRDHLKYK